jgi:type II secretory ATPase GspE/PulE/Tfp pilus assembly ATPase PilB-like protein
VAEKLSASDELHDAIMERAPRRRFVEIASREKENIETMAWRMVADGHTSGDEVRRVLAGGTI